MRLAVRWCRRDPKAPHPKLIFERAVFRVGTGLKSRMCGGGWPDSRGFARLLNPGLYSLTLSGSWGWASLWPCGEQGNFGENARLGGGRVRVQAVEMAYENLLSRIMVDPEICSEKSCVRGLR
jgi:hypothetical protein